MSATTLKALLGLLLLAAPVTIAFGTVTDDTSSTPSPTLAATSAAEGEVVETFSGDLDPVPSTGELELRLDHGAVRVIGWDKPSYEIQILRAPSSASVPSEPEVHRNFSDDSTEDHLDLSLTVDQDGVFQVQAHAGTEQGGIRTGQSSLAIVARVPSSIAYSSVFACQGQWYEHPDVVEPPQVAAADGEKGPCMQPEQASQQRSALVVRQGNATLDVQTGAENVSGDRLTVEVISSDVALADLSFGTIEVTSSSADIAAEDVSAGLLDVASASGDVSATGLDDDETTVSTGSGDVALGGSLGTLEVSTSSGDVALDGDAPATTVSTSSGDLDGTGALGTLDISSSSGDVTLSGEAAEGVLATSSGDIALDLTPTAVGTLETSSSSGDVTVTVPTGPTYGYDVSLVSGSGDAEISLDDAQEEPDDQDNRAEATTSNFQDREIRWTIDGDASSGDLTVTDGSADTAAEEDEEPEEPEPPASPVGSLVSS